MVRVSLPDAVPSGDRERQAASVTGTPRWSSTRPAALWPGRAWTRQHPRGVDMTATPSPTFPLSTADRARPAAQPARTAPTPRRLAGRYRYDRRAGTWSWSPEMSVLLNLARNGAHPCTELLVHSLHPGDRPRVLEAVAGACTAGLPFALRVRLGSRGGG